MKVLLVGSGGREHALALKISESLKLTKLYITPGNPGTAKIGENINLDVNNQPAIVEFCKFEKIDLVVIGPEQPLVDGLGDILRENFINVFGPGKNGAMLEGDKHFAKKIMQKAEIPTSESSVFFRDRHAEALNHLAKCNYPLVLKASGLAAGKGVSICMDFPQAVEAIEDCFTNRIFGDSGDRVLMEEFLEGEEASVFVITDGKKYVILPASQDHKRIGDNDTGKNTGGMGAYAPAPVASQRTMECVENDIVKPLLKVLEEDKIDYRGCIYVGLMITSDGPKVIEFNCRFGDPETQVVLPVLKGDFLELLHSSAIGEINENSVEYNGGVAVCVVTSSSGYPERYKKGFEITGLDEDLYEEGTYVYHAGTKEENGKIITNGGRVLGVTAMLEENDIKLCKEKAYRAVKNINYTGMYFRTDISDKAFNKNPFEDK